MSVEEVMQIIQSWYVQLPVWATFILGVVWKIVQARILNKNNSTNSIRLANNESQVADLQTELSVATSTIKKQNSQIEELQNIINVLISTSRNEKVKSLAIKTKNATMDYASTLKEVVQEASEIVEPIVEEVKKVVVKRKS